MSVDPLGLLLTNDHRPLSTHRFTAQFHIRIDWATDVGNYQIHQSGIADAGMANPAALKLQAHTRALVVKISWEIWDD
jgi:hypothetical protein